MTAFDATAGDRDHREGQGGWLGRRLDDARKRLVETGTRNRLVHTNRRSKKPATLSLLHPEPDTAFRRIAVDRVGFRFVADPAATERERLRGAEEGEAEAEPVTSNIEFRQHKGDTFQTRLGEGALHKKLTRFAREAKTLEEEQGINILFLAMGFLRWYEDDASQIVREGPLVLVPVSLVRDTRRSIYTLRVREDDISTNLPLAERLREQSGITIPEIPENDDISLYSYFDAVAEAVSSRSRWSVDRMGLELGFFSFAKLLMYSDLAPDAWPTTSLLSHPLLRGLLQDGFPVEDPLFPDDTKIDERFQPDDLIHVLDADGSQTLAIETVRAGQNVVIHGPPGTGKSQTIANIIAAAAHDEKSVLFIAEKMVALEVVYDRLKKAGLGPLCLELHSRKANKRILAEELKRTLDTGAAEPDVEDETARLTETRDALNRIANQLHAPIGATGMSAFRVIADLVRAKGLGLPPPSISLSGMERWTQADYVTITAAVRRYAALIKAAGPPHAHPWRGVRNETLQPPDLDRIAHTVRGAAERVRDLHAFASSVAAFMQDGAPTTLSTIERLKRFLALLSTAPKDSRRTLERLNPLAAHDLGRADELVRDAGQLITAITAEMETFRTAALKGDATDVRARLIAGARSFFKRWGGAYRAASAQLAGSLSDALPKSAAERVALVDRLIELKANQERLDSLSREAKALFGDLWKAEHFEFAKLASITEWLRQVRAEGFGFDLTPALGLLERHDLLMPYRSQLGDKEAAAHAAVQEIVATIDLDAGAACGDVSIEEVRLDDLANYLDGLASNVNRYSEWRDLYSATRILNSYGLLGLVECIANDVLDQDRAIEEIRYARAERLWKVACESNPEFRELYSIQRDSLVQRFCQLERDRRQSVTQLIRGRHAAQMPRGAVGDMGIIRGEIARRRGHMPIRKLMKRVGQTIQKIKPVFLMSPISVAQFIPPGALEFDLLVIDEASQVRPEDALGVIARAKQIVIVGDGNQLPPTNFFNRLLSESDEDEDDDDASGKKFSLAGAAKVTELESILTLCIARGIGSKTLRWHYRSKHPSLIEVSNEIFYTNNLLLPPAPVISRDDDGLVLVRVPGAYDRGRKRTNEIEARATVEALLEHTHRYPNRSIGIVTFSTAQRDLIADLVDEARRRVTALDTFLNEQAEETFVKNLENVQGDERDHILVSVGYGPRMAGARLDSMNFGPVSTDGGKRRLNVLFTRARYRCEVFCSFDPADIDTERARSEGVEALKRYLSYAETGHLEAGIATGEDHDSPFEEDVARVIRSLGFLADAQVGTAGFKIDLGVRDRERPGRYILAVECDGATYHSARWARERDRLRQEILEGQGWRFHRIWSTDWFYRRSQEMERLKAALEAARIEAGRPRSVSLSKRKEHTEPVVESEVSSPLFIAEPYELASFIVRDDSEPHELPVGRMAAYVKRIVDLEGPTHEEEVARRVAELFGKDRAGSRIKSAVVHGLTHLSRADREYQENDGFWCTQVQATDPPIRDRTAAPPSLQRAAMLPPLEIRAAVKKILEENGAVGRHDLAVAVARLFGFQRTGSELRSFIDREIVRLIELGHISEDGQSVRQN